MGPRSSRRARVYPRRCGGAGLKKRWRRSAKGLSPQVRGSRVAAGHDRADGGSIPAGAGEPAGNAAGVLAEMVYPRRCGGARVVTIPIGHDAGLSPQVRGSRERPSTPPGMPRSIPAGAGEPSVRARRRSWPRVYPRRCGGAAPPRTGCRSRSGLSPQVRGSPLRAPPPPGRRRSIPAGAGEPAYRSRPERGPGVYPRRCGGARRTRRGGCWPRGLSPQVRGSPAQPGRHDQRGGSIPAGAGEPTSAPWTNYRVGVYPRRCGGAILLPTSLPSSPGLSPQVRGSRCGAGHGAASHGSIPAGAGEPISRVVVKVLPEVYPRRCGGAVCRQLGLTHEQGLSPQVRGSHPYRGIYLQSWRSIPAGAGEPSSPPTTAPRARVYPRRCGGARRRGLLRAPGRGLSPQVRGSPSHIALPPPVHGSIPAGAGEPAIRSGCGASARVYPRRCGGAARPRRRSSVRGGLSPQVRGSHLPGARRDGARGSIPAGAGEPTPPAATRARIQVYPRRCGGAPLPHSSESSSKGLSPQVRGSRGRGPRAAARVGSIPAGAGEPSTGADRGSFGGVYPRRCGGAADVAGLKADVSGLSPQVRGSRLRGLANPMEVGSIPAGAGEPTRRSVRSRSTRVYPRRCGGARTSCSISSAAPGLSPQVRGSPVRAGRPGVRRRSIPAGAGEPTTRSRPPSRTWVYPRRCGGAA